MQRRSPVPARGHDAARGAEGDKRSRGFTIAELLIVVAILGTVAGIGVAYYRDALEKARIARTMADIRVLEKDLALYKLDAQKFPESLAELGRGNRLDAWGRSYAYVRFCEPGETRGGGDRGGGRGDRDDRDRGGGGDPDEDRDRGRDGRDDRDRDDREREDRGRDDRDRGRDGDGRRGDDGSDDCESRIGKMRRDRFLNPLNSDYDLYSTGKDGESKRQLNKRESWDDVIRAVNGMYVGLASDF